MSTQPSRSWPTVALRIGRASARRNAVSPSEPATSTARLITPEGAAIEEGTREFFDALFTAIGESEPDYDVLRYAIAALGFIRLYWVDEITLAIELNPRATSIAGVLTAQQQLLKFSAASVVRITRVDESLFPSREFTSIEAAIFGLFTIYQHSHKNAKNAPINIPLTKPRDHFTAVSRNAVNKLVDLTMFRKHTTDVIPKNYSNRLFCTRLVDFLNQTSARDSVVHLISTIMSMGDADGVRAVAECLRMLDDPAAVHRAVTTEITTPQHPRWESRQSADLELTKVEFALKYYEAHAINSARAAIELYNHRDLYGLLEESIRDSLQITDLKISGTETARAATESAINIPRPLWRKRKNIDATLTPAAFVAKYYAAEMAAGTLHRAMIEDRILVRDLTNWLRTNDMPEGIDIPTYPQWNKRQLDALGITKRFDVAAREIARLHAVAKERGRIEQPKQPASTRRRSAARENDAA